jgi:hypothetical protein
MISASESVFGGGGMEIIYFRKKHISNTSDEAAVRFFFIFFFCNFTTIDKQVIQRLYKNLATRPSAIAGSRPSVAPLVKIQLVGIFAVRCKCCISSVMIFLELLGRVKHLIIYTSNRTSAFRKELYLAFKLCC